MGKRVGVILSAIVLILSAISCNKHVSPAPVVYQTPTPVVSITSRPKAMRVTDFTGTYQGYYYYHYDANGRLITADFLNPSDSLQMTLTFVYNGSGINDRIDLYTTGSGTTTKRADQLFLWGKFMEQTRYYSSGLVAGFTDMDYSSDLVSAQNYSDSSGTATGYSQHIYTGNYLSRVNDYDAGGTPGNYVIFSDSGNTRNVAIYNSSGVLQSVKYEIFMETGPCTLPFDQFFAMMNYL